jgi:pSer/pThr/pTyr-binding forkhead associated (FHA) protein
MAEVFLEHANGEQIGELIRLDKKEMLIGRLPDCDIVVESRFTSVSQRHAVLRKTSDGWVIIDVGTSGKGSTFGTYMNENQLISNQPYILNHGDEIRLGTRMGKYFRLHGQGTIPISQPGSLKSRLSINEGRRLLILDGRPMQISFTRQEFEFLLILWHESGSICNYTKICYRLWPDIQTITGDIDADLKVRINTLAHNIRRKLINRLDGFDILESYRGIGYRLRF